MDWLPIGFVYISLLCSVLAKNANLKWAWLHGETVGNQHTNEVEILFDNEHPARQASKKRGFFYPGSRAGATSCQVSDSAFWMFGGKGYDDKPTNEPRLLNDLWEFDTNKQTWNLVDDVDPNHRNQDSNSRSPIPKPRKLASSCGVQGLVFVIFGGEDENGSVLNDTWVYYNMPSEWLVLEFSEKIATPSGRKDMAYWCLRDKLTVFGGVDSNGHSIDDMWVFSLKTLHWQQITPHQEIQKPKGRAGPLTWVTSDGSLYMFGGYVIDKSRKVEGLVDLWQFESYNITWKLIDMCLPNNTLSSLFNLTSTEGKSGNNNRHIQSAGNICPAARRHGAAWTEATGNLWFFGGEILPANKVTYINSTSEADFDVFSSSLLMADLWRYHITKRRWEWMGVGGKPGMGAHYSTNFESPFSSHPGARCQMVAWTRKGQMFLYGGLGFDARNKTSFLNDVWRMTHSKASYRFAVERDWFRSIPPWTVFLVTLGSFGGIVFAFGVGFYLKKMLESPNHNPSEFRVKYSRVSQDNFYVY